MSSDSLALGAERSLSVTSLNAFAQVPHRAPRQQLCCVGMPSGEGPSCCGQAHAVAVRRAAWGGWVWKEAVQTLRWETRDESKRQSRGE